jgi:uncharacterized protein (TIGR02596 family)
MIPSRTPPHSRHPRGFTLIELLAVIAVIAVVIAFAVPAANQILRGSQLTQGAQVLGDRLSFARQLAISRNRSIEVRFYRFGDPEQPGEDPEDPETGKWRAIQVFEVLENGAALPVGPVVRLPRMVIMDGDEFSTLLRESIRGEYLLGKDDDTAPELPIELGKDKKVGKNYEFVAFRFLPDGSTDLPVRATTGSGSPTTPTTGDTWYVTLVGLADEGKEIKEINYFTIQVDPISGTQKSYRPNAG